MRRITVLLAAVALISAACGDDLGSPFEEGTPDTTMTDDTQPAPLTTPQDTEGTGPPGPAPGGNGSISEVLSAYEDEPLVLEYAFGDGDDAQMVTIAQDPTQDPPVYATLIGPAGDEGRFLTLGDRSLVCGAPGEDCLEFPAEMGMNMGQAMLGPLLTGVLALEDVESTPGFTVEEGATTIAGRSARCFTFSPTMLATGADVVFVRQCVDAELGFVLLFEGLEAGGESVERILELLAWDRPNPSFFEPSGPVTTMPGGG